MIKNRRSCNCPDVWHLKKTCDRSAHIESAETVRQDEQNRGQEGKWRLV